ncbi:uncharacterized protein PHALS_13871 [Plasmopara halstedii]|uniref:Uncharacterized protein n=1 Tax=Plasmopara halstedii TaxID=4781 RepID=A0A0P1A4B2_PLAHL|nr:uncharacterized protein PHALS_13871 [Plasmopara halstedii]CEG35109.1 hypothetical protein PHALS_13871 [Plasmopara halstedii]|eukprot:XP_024571478.1 hypothetical protein PHALS_13871 [Plasmopara halstedii]
MNATSFSKSYKWIVPRHDRCERFGMKEIKKKDIVLKAVDVDNLEYVPRQKGRLYRSDAEALTFDENRYPKGFTDREPQELWNGIWARNLRVGGDSVAYSCAR